MPLRQQRWGFSLSTQTEKAKEMVSAFKNFESWAMVNQRYSCTSTFISVTELEKMLDTLKAEAVDGLKVSIGANEINDAETGKTTYRGLELIFQPINFTSDEGNDFSHTESPFLYWTNDSVASSDDEIEPTEPPVIKNPPFGESL